METEAKVYVTQIPSRMEGGAWVPKVDITPARKFGAIEIMMPAGYFYVDERSFGKLNVALADFKTGDFLLPMGDPVLMTVAAAILGSRREPFNVLKWDRKSSEYYVYQIHSG